MLDILITTIPIYLTVLLTYILKQRRIVPDGALKVVSSITFNIVSPMLVFEVLYGLKFDMSNLALLLVPFVAALLLFLIYSTTGKLMQWDRKSHGGVVITTMCFAIGTFAYPFILANFSDELFANVVLADIVIFFLFLTFGYAVALYYGGNGGDIKKVFLRNFVKSPIIISMLLALTLTYLNVEVPERTFEMTNYFSRSFPFLAATMMGLAIRVPDLKVVGKAIGIFTSRLILLVGLVYGTYILFDIPEIQAKALMLCFAAPFCAFSIIFSEEQKLNTELVSQLGLISSLVSLLVYPIVIWVLK